jgi:hypothetical protein
LIDYTHDLLVSFRDAKYCFRHDGSPKNWFEANELLAHDLKLTMNVGTADLRCDSPITSQLPNPTCKMEAMEKAEA